jgi:hypothetical protein
MLAKATIETRNARRYLAQFCKHFAHKLPVDIAPDNAMGAVGFGAGACILHADDGKLDLALEAQDDAMANLQDVVVRHLARFAFREHLVFNWDQLAT